MTAEPHLDVDFIIEQAATLVERMCASDRCDSVASSQHVERVCEDWLAALSSVGDPAALDRRLAWSGWTHPDIAAALGVRAATSRKPRWARILQEVHNATKRDFCTPREADAKPGPEPGFVDASQPLPFEELFVPCVRLACHMLRRRLGRTDETISHRLTPKAQGCLERQLLVQLTSLSEQPCFADFHATRPAGHNLFLKVSGGPKESHNRRLYERFVQAHGAEGLTNLFHAFPVLARLIGTRIDLWIDATAEFVCRLEADWELLRQRWPSIELHGNADEITTGLSDPHHEGRSVLGVRFSDGTKLVYKPRSLELDLAFAEFVTWCSPDGLPVTATPTVLCGDGYGWMQTVQSSALLEEADADCFYRNAGALLFHMYILGGTDGHRENVIACGDRLVLVDTETLLHAQLDSGDERAGDGPSLDALRKTGLWPSWQLTDGGRQAVDDSGLGATAVGQRAGSRTVSVWRAINSDDMHRSLVAAEPTPGLNEPSMHGTQLNPLEHVDQIVEGFARAYRGCLCRRQERADELARLLSRFSRLSTRYVLRPTATYYGVFARSLQPAHLRSGVQWGLALELLMRAAVGGEQKPGWWAMVPSELAQMAQLDVPCFAVELGTNVIRLAGGDLSVTSGLQAAKRRIAAMSAEELAHQVELIRASFAVRNPRGAMAHAVDSPWEAPTATSPLDTKECLAEALAIAEEIERRALHKDDGAYWLGFQYLPSADRVLLELTPQGLYDGAAGIAVFLAAVDRLHGTDRFCPLWTAALAPTRKFSGSVRQSERFANLGIGMGAGLGGLIFALVQLSALAGPEQHAWLARSARGLAELVSDSVVGRDEVFDVIGGSAGAILGLLALFGMTQEQLVLDRAKLCGQRLVDGFGPLVDSMPHGKPILTGFSHGTSGIALALARLARDTGDQETLDLSHRIFSYESSQYDALQGNWPDLRAPGRREFMTSWCHGAPGIALARLDALACDGEGDHRRQWQRAIASVLAAQDLGVDHLCCGNMGLVEVLLQSGRTLDRADLVAAAEARAARVVRRVRSRGAYRLFMGEREAVFNPGLFQGVAGIGYQLLRVSHPEALASVLSFHRTPACGAPAPTEPYLRRPPMVGEFHSSGELQRKVDSATECL